MIGMRRNVALLAACQALMMSANTLIIATTALVGLALAEQKILATLPVSLQWIATMLTAIPAAMLMRRAGRRAGLMIGVTAAIVGGTLCTLAIFYRHFALFCVGSALVGAFNAFGQQYRFAAADAASVEFRSRAISLVLAGGVVAAFAGPNLARFTLDWFEPVTYAGAYAANIVLYGLSFVLLAFVAIPPGPTASHHNAGARFAAIITQGGFLVAAASAMIGYGVMNLVMTATPLAMAKHGFGFGETAIVIQWHVLAMFAPSFVTGHVIRRFGVINVIMAGALLQLACVLVNLYGQAEWNFVVALVLLGLGWNFLFIGATTLLTDTYRGPEKARAQGLNDFLVFGMVALTALSSGALHHAYGWVLLNMAMIPLIVTALACGLWFQRRRASTRQAQMPT